MTKQEQIEKMAKVMCLFCKEMTEEKDCERGKECFDWRLKEARFYYQQGCQIINKDSVVLTREEFERLKSQQQEIERLKDENEHFENNMKSVLEIEKKQAVKDFAEKLKAKAVQEAEVEDYVCYIVNRLLKEYEK